MGSWGVKAMESDYGLDLLIIAEKRYLQGVKFKNFHVKHITELLRAYIVDEFVQESNGWEAQYIDFFYDYTFPYHYDEAVMLVAECLNDYFRNGKFRMEIFEEGKDKPTRKTISEFIFTANDLNKLLADLKNILDPTRGLYESWKESQSFDEWQAHIKMLCESIENQIKQADNTLSDSLDDEEEQEEM